ncbi:MAG TPA: MGMT family protein [Bacteroidetes bacterium]|nr:MGMT family protein [Bacteroidota bacterium]
MSSTFHQRVVEIIKAIPCGKVATYGQIAAYAGNPSGARRVAWVLHSSSEKNDLPWHRVVNRNGRISLKENLDYQQQKALLEQEGVQFDSQDNIDFDQYLWIPAPM